MNKYLQKIAENKKEPNTLTTLGVHGLAGIGGAVVGTEHAYAMSDTLHRHNYNKKNQASNWNTVRKMMKDNKLDVTFSKHKLKPRNTGIAFVDKLIQNKHKTIGKSPHGGYYNTKAIFGKNFVTGKSSDVVMHELGHAKDLKRFSHLKNLTHNTSSFLSTGNHLGTAGVIGATAQLASDEDTRKYAPLVPLVAAAPMVRSEAMANYHGAKAILAHRGLKAAAKFTRKIALPNMAAYTAKPAMMATAALGANQYLDYLKKKHDKQVPK